MKRRKKSNISEESYWKSATDIMAGVLLVILLVLMLLLLYVTQINHEKEQHKADHDYYYAELNNNYGDVQPTTVNNHVADGNYNAPPRQGGGGGGGGEDDPGTEVPQEVHPDEGHDKCAVFVTVVDEETGNVIKKEGTLFELYAEKNGVGGLQTLHTYYPKKVEYKQYQTTSAGTFYLPEKITAGWYSFHNLTAPEGYGLAENFDFQITESLDWPEPYLVKIPFSPSKNRIYIRSIDAETKEKVAGQTYEIFAAEDVVTLDGTVRYKSGQKVGEIKCDDNGAGASEKLYLGKYYLVQKTTAAYYARFLSRIEAEVKLTNAEKDAVIVECSKTKATFVLTDEYSGEPVKGAVYSVTDKKELVTDENGTITVTEFDKDKTYTVTLQSVPEPYRIASDKQEFAVDKDGMINGEAQPVYKQTAYTTRLSVNIKDVVFKNSVAGVEMTLFDESDNEVDVWDAFGEARVIEGLEPGAYYLDIGGSSRIKINVKDTAAMQTSEFNIWTLWDTILVITAVVLLALVTFVTIRLIRRRKKKTNEKDANKEK